MKFPEHREYSPARAENSYHDFVCDLRSAIALNGGRFSLIDNFGTFSAALIDRGEESVLVLEGVDWKAELDEFDLSEFWVLVNKGPVDSSRLVGMARENVSPLFSLLSSLSYIRPVEISRDSDISRIAVELRRHSFAYESAAA